MQVILIPLFSLSLIGDDDEDVTHKKKPSFDNLVKNLEFKLSPLQQGGKDKDSESLGSESDLASSGGKGKRSSTNHGRTSSMESISSVTSSGGIHGRVYELQCDTAKELDEWLVTLVEHGGCVRGDKNHTVGESLIVEESAEEKVAVIEEEDFLKYETTILRRSAMGRHNSSIKKTAEIFKLWSICRVRIDDGALYIYKGTEEDSPHTTSFTLDTIDWVRYSDSSDNKSTEFDISSGVDVMRFKGKDRDESDRFIDNLRFGIQQVKNARKQRSKEDLKKRAEAMVPDWIRKFDECEEGDRVVYITRNLDYYFIDVDYDEEMSSEKMLKILQAIENISVDLLDIAVECKKPSIIDGKNRLDVLEMYFKLYHIRIVMEITLFTQASSDGPAVEVLGTESLLNLILCISHYHKVLEFVVADTHLTEERFQVHALDTETNELVKRYVGKVSMRIRCFENIR
jgi:hypothetical protein